MKRTIKLFSVFLMFTFVFVNASYSQLINHNRRKKGTGSGRVAASAKTPVKPVEVPQWMRRAPRARNSQEKRYDKNRDGRLQSNEVKKFLADIIDVVESRGAVSVSSDILKIYDVNRDGVIRKSELSGIKADIKM